MVYLFGSLIIVYRTNWEKYETLALIGKYGLCTVYMCVVYRKEYNFTFRKDKEEMNTPEKVDDPSIGKLAYFLNLITYYT